MIALVTSLKECMCMCERFEHSRGNKTGAVIGASRAAVALQDFISPRS